MFNLLLKRKSEHHTRGTCVVSLLCPFPATFWRDSCLPCVSQSQVALATVRLWMHRGTAIKPHLHLIFPTEIVEVHKQHFSWCGIERDLEHYKLQESKRQHSLERVSVLEAKAFIGVNQGVQAAKALRAGVALWALHSTLWGLSTIRKWKVKPNCCTFLQYQQMALFPNS